MIEEVLLNHNANYENALNLPIMKFHWIWWDVITTSLTLNLKPIRLCGRCWTSCKMFKNMGACMHFQVMNIKRSNHSLINLRLHIIVGLVGSATSCNALCCWFDSLMVQALLQDSVTYNLCMHEFRLLFN